MHTTNYTDTFITVAPDSDAVRGTRPRESANPSITLRTFQLIHENPYEYTSDDVIFTVFADRKGIAKSKRAAARREFFAKGRPCLRASDLAKKYGWGIHSDSDGRVALYGVETAEYRAFAGGARSGRDGGPVTVKPAMRSRR